VSRWVNVEFKWTRSRGREDFAMLADTLGREVAQGLGMEGHRGSGRAAVRMTGNQRLCLASNAKATAALKACGWEVCTPGSLKAALMVAS
jgi:hypothetical protein